MPRACSAIWAVLGSIRLAPDLDACLDAVLAATLDIEPSIDVSKPFG